MLVLWHDGVQQRPLKVTLLSEDFMAGFIAEMYITHGSQWPEYLYSTGLKETFLQGLLQPTETKYTVTLQNPKTQELTTVYCPNLDFIRCVYTFCQVTGGFSEIERQTMLSHQNKPELGVEILDKVWERFSTVILNISGMTVAEAYADLRK
jgi:hypothetical protein